VSDTRYYTSVSRSQLTWCNRRTTAPVE